MSGHNAFEQMVSFTDKSGSIRDPISVAQYEEWKKLYTFEGLKGIRYGQSFCNHFGITDNILYYSLTPDQADTYIIENYLERS